MEIKKGYKQTEIGIIPEDWEVRKLGEITVRFLNGGTPSTDIPNYWNGSIPWITGADFENHKVSNIRRFITKEAITNSSTNIVSKDNLLVVTRTGVGKMAIAPFDIAISQDITGIFLKESINSLYIFYYFSHNSSMLTSLNQGTSIVGITREVFEKIQIPVPDLLEQTAIAAVLSDIDKYILSLERLIAKKKAIKQGAMQNLLSGKIRLKGFKGEWVDYEIGKIGKFYSGLTGKTANDFGKGNAKYITFLNVLTNAVIKTDILERVNIGRNEQQNAVQRGDLFFNTSSETPEEVGMCAVLQDELWNTYLNSFCFGYRLTINEVNPLFISYLFNSVIGRKIMFNLAQGATRYNLSKSYFEKTIITIPILSEQTAIATILSDMDAEIEALQAKLSKAKLVKQGAMQELLTGKIRLMNTSSQSQKLSENRIIPITAHVVGGHVVNKLYGSRGWGRTKLQKSMHLIDYHCQLDFGYEYIRNIAGPDSQALMNHIDSKFRQYRHVRIEIKNDGRGGKHYNYIPTSMITEIEQVFNSYSTETQEAINNLLNKIKKMDLARAEIVSTLYAVWNNRIIKKQPINDGLLLRDFYDWSAHKSDYSQDLVLKGLNYMRKEGIIPIGWGKYIDKKITL